MATTTEERLEALEKRIDDNATKVAEIEKKLRLISTTRWFPNMVKWGCKVRDDILALEDAVLDLAQGIDLPGNLTFRRSDRRIEKDKDRYVPRHTNGHGDPGDPPRDPWE